MNQALFSPGYKQRTELFLAKICDVCLIFAQLRYQFLWRGIHGLPATRNNCSAIRIIANPILCFSGTVNLFYSFPPAELTRLSSSLWAIINSNFFSLALVNNGHYLSRHINHRGIKESSLFSYCWIMNQTLSVFTEFIFGQWSEGHRLSWRYGCKYVYSRHESAQGTAEFVDIAGNRLSYLAPEET